MGMTLSEMLTRAIRTHGDRIALQIDESAWSYEDLDKLSDALASGLRRLGVSRGHPVALYLRNCAEYVVADLALLKLGAIKVPLNEYQTLNDVLYVLQDTDAVVLIAHQSLLDNLGGSLIGSTNLAHVIRVGNGDLLSRSISHHNWSDVLAEPEPVTNEVLPNDSAMITYTGGTTGKPKGVVHTQAGLAANLLAHIEAGEIMPTDTMLLTTPLPHSAGYNLQACLLLGGKILVQDGFDAKAFYTLVEARRVTWTFLVPTMLYRLLDDPHLDRYDHSSLRTIVYGAAPMSTTRLRTAIEKFGLCFIQLYGQTECPNYITALTKEDHRNPDLHSSCGKAVPLVEIATTGRRGRNIGEVIVRAPYVLKEYFNNPSATKSALVDGWLHTGDIGYIDTGGYLFLKDRAKDMVISGGMNVYTTEVEQALKRNPSVADAAVIGLPHDDWGEQVHAVVVVRSEISREALIEHCRGELSRYKVPKSIEFREALPLTVYGKIDKKALREQLV